MDYSISFTLLSVPLTCDIRKLPAERLNTMQLEGFSQRVFHTQFNRNFSVLCIGRKYTTIPAEKFDTTPRKSIINISATTIFATIRI